MKKLLKASYADIYIRLSSKSQEDGMSQKKRRKKNVVNIAKRMELLWEMSIIKIKMLWHHTIDLFFTKW